MNDRPLVEWFIIVILSITIIIMAIMNGCVLYRHDVIIDPNRTYDSVTAWSILKDFDVDLDPNSIKYKSNSKNVKVVTPYGAAESRN